MLFRGKAVTIVCADLDRSVRFYRDVLGARHLAVEHGALPWLELGALTLALIPNGDERSPAAFGTHALHMLWLEVDDLAAAHAHLTAHGASIEEQHDGEFIIVADPDGLLLEIWQSLGN